jgi:hypothetical protein
MKIERISLIWAFAFLSLVRPVYATYDAQPTAPGDKVIKVMDMLRRCPSWIDYAANEVTARTSITRAYWEIGHYDTKIVRAALQGAFNAAPAGSLERFQIEAKGFALLRVLFEIPEGMIENSGHHGSWGNPGEGGRIGLLWPYRHNDRGRLCLVGEFHEYMGVPYNLMSDFDSMASHYKRRVISGEF